VLPISGFFCSNPGSPTQSVAIGRHDQRFATFIPRSQVSRLDRGLIAEFTFLNFVQGVSNELACTVAQEVARHPGVGYSPLLIYGGTGLGKTHLTHAIGNQILKSNPQAEIFCASAERFVRKTTQALRDDQIEAFRKCIRAVDVLLIEDIQFLSGKVRAREELFHTLNALLDSKKQIILTCDQYPKELEGLAARLSTYFGAGLTVALEPPDFETRVAILVRKAQKRSVILDEAVAFLIAKRIGADVRGLEGALNLLSAHARLSGRPITEGFAEEVLRDLHLAHGRVALSEKDEPTEL